MILGVESYYCPVGSLIAFVATHHQSAASWYVLGYRLPLLLMRAENWRARRARSIPPRWAMLMRWVRGTLAPHGPQILMCKIHRGPTHQPVSAFAYR